MNERHALIIGGTGMLADVSLWLTEMGYRVSVIGQTIEKHRQLRRKAKDPQLLNSLAIDYSQLSVVETHINKAMDENGPISLVVSWTPDYRSLELVGRLVSERIADWKLFHVKGSSRYLEDDPIEIAANCQYRSIYLGFIIEGSQSRWLNHQEIACGVIHNIKKDNDVGIVGTLSPYEKRPGY
ncbi:hypothetical protein [Sediminibacillus albus]|uniref:Short chain dehydrogenase n=1 Tax=Sediminibacillus albus TaxID=407036 RepID=A0A1G8X2Y0_9BACI|nr:hypothetical protein [Sediminibacillus albus]SDJ84686.1 hypothetical protein SAMN05216243_1119 [Sediminibacillus albus]